MDLEQLVHCARGGDVNAFVELTRRFQHFAFGSALALLGDFHQAEDVVQDTFVAAWSALPALSDPAAFPGWLRGIVRHHAFHSLRRRLLDTVPLEAAENVRSDGTPADDQLDQQQQLATAMAAMATLPATLREPAISSIFHGETRHAVRGRGYLLIGFDGVNSSVSSNCRTNMPHHQHPCPWRGSQRIPSRLAERGFKLVSVSSPLMTTAYKVLGHGR
jgi:DNA-directed RNA polymerase specialized sigma24 family protein